MQNKGYFFWAWNDLDKWRHNSVAGESYLDPIPYLKHPVQR